jgi:hypothetical protein
MHAKGYAAPETKAAVCHLKLDFFAATREWRAMLQRGQPRA